MKTIIETKNLTKIYKEAGQELVALKNINLKVTKGELLAIMGPSGSSLAKFWNSRIGLTSLPNYNIITLVSASPKSTL